MHQEPATGGRRQALAASLGVNAALAVALGFLLVERASPDPRRLLELALASEEVKRAATLELVDGSEGTWDTFLDADVGRVMQRNVEGREFRGVPVSSNRYGMREADYELAKPAGTTRVVLLGDSFVYGYKVAAEDRLGVFLRDFLLERGSSPAIECLHLAASSWNVLAETSYLRRQLDELRPDLVVHVVVANDLDDAKGARGFGELGAYSPQVRRRAGGLVSQLSPPGLWPQRLQTYLMFGLDHESRERYASAAAELERLAAAVEAGGGRYLLLASWESFNPMVRRHLAAGLREEQVAWVSTAFTQDERYRIDATDRHWNRAGHERIAMLLYGLAQRRDLLPGLGLAPWEEAAAAVAEIHAAGDLEASFMNAYEGALLEHANEQARAEIDFVDLDRLAVKQVHGGVFGPGHVAPYAALFLKRAGGTELVVRGERFAGHALAGGVARVSVEGEEVGRIELAGEPLRFEERWPLPAAARGRDFLTVRFESDDYRYANVANGDCAAFRLERVAVE